MKKAFYISIESKIINRIFAGLIFIGILILAFAIFLPTDLTFSGSSTFIAFTNSWKYFFEIVNNIDNLNETAYITTLLFVHNQMIIAIWFSAILVVSFIKCIITLTKGRDCGIISQFITAFVLCFIHYFITYNHIYVDEYIPNPLFYVIFIVSILFIVGYAILAHILNKTFMKNMVLIILLLIIIMLTSIMAIIYLGPIYACEGNVYGALGIPGVYSENMILGVVNAVSIIVTIFFIGLMSSYRGILKSLLRNELSGFNSDSLAFVFLSFFTISNAFGVTTFITLAKNGWGIQNIINEFLATLSTRLIILYILPVLIIGLLIASAIVKGVLNSKNNNQNIPTKPVVEENKTITETVIKESKEEPIINEIENEIPVEEQQEEIIADNTGIEEETFENKIEDSQDDSVTDTIEEDEK